MALTSQGERRSMRRTLRNEKGNQVLSLHLAYEGREVVFQMERIDQEYCDEHAEDVQEAVSSFLEDANAALRDAGHVMISP
ncbi:MAG: hypothetical protein ACI4WX_14900 [Aristaeellaceae bacterium]